ncbi:TetR/AcrR family transcriptional regulator [Amaricoccus solimangrovi]|uniref:TetR/AcrR family transcriptional regulator n=1 Tax=Amaricoccus solimangrovi TaxID=2589815 RepID=A0A501WVP0_9RHOB|nr:TetR/AcrR family transcriptional regulator [Amaricoccus solimangrovi]TPE51021.1 TetR/AcrR family transcriptional regulator [Amaricoccus solimangrovi]
MTQPLPRKDARLKLLDAALTVIRRQGYAATSVDELCRAAGVTKGAFFHHFRSKEALAVAAAAHFGALAEGLFAADWTTRADPAERVLGYVALRRAIIDGPFEEFTCLLGTMAQEAYASSEAIRAACAEGITGHAARLEPDIRAALEAAGRDGAEAGGLALHVQAVLQGGFVLAKATGDPEAARRGVDHLARYLRLLFRREA